MPPSVFLGERTVDTSAWTERDSVMAMAMEDYESGICSSCGRPVAECTDPANEGRYEVASVVCHGTVALDIASKQFEDHDHPSALRFSVTLPAPGPT